MGFIDAVKGGFMKTARVSRTLVTVAVAALAAAAFAAIAVASRERFILGPNDQDSITNKFIPPSA